MATQYILAKLHSHLERLNCEVSTCYITFVEFPKHLLTMWHTQMVFIFATYVATLKTLSKHEGKEIHFLRDEMS